MTAAELLLSSDVFEDQTFADLSIEAAELSGKDFLRCTFRGARLPQSRWDGVRLEECVFEDCDLSRLRPAPRTLSGVVFRRSKLMGVEWSKIPNPAVSFEECDLRYGAFLDMVLQGAQFKSCKAAEVTFSSCDLTRADFTGTDLSGAVFEGCVLAQADLRGARGAFPAPATNKVRGARISVETAALLAIAQGMQVEGYDD